MDLAETIFVPPESEDPMVVDAPRQPPEGEEEEVEEEGGRCVGGLPGQTSSNKASCHPGAARIIDDVVVPATASLPLCLPAPQTVAIAATVRVVTHL